MRIDTRDLLVEVSNDGETWADLGREFTPEQYKYWRVKEAPKEAPRAADAPPAMKHSPGPWVWGWPSREPGENPTPDHVLCDANGDIVLDGEALTQQPWNGTVNSRLVAAAPELLAALKNVVGSWKGEYETPESARAEVAAAEGLIREIEG